MTDEQIKALAREYAEAMTDDEAGKEVEYEFALLPFRWLAKHYEIISKEKVKEEFEKAVDEGKSPYYSFSRIEGSMKIHLLESLFPQTLKS